MRSTKIYIIILNWNGKKDTIECLASLSNVAFSSYQPLVVDNGSTDGSVKEIRAAFPNVPIHQTGANLGFAAGNNQGIEWALSKNAEWILLLNNDTVVSPDFLTAFMEAAKQQPKAKILGAKIYRYTGRDSKIGIWQGGALNLNQALPAPKQLNLTSLAMQAGHKFSGCPTPPEPIFQSRAVFSERNTIDHLGGFWNPRIGEFESPAQNQIDDGVSFEEMSQVETVCGAALLMHRSVPETIGLLEPRFFLFWEETDFCIRARRSGFEVWTAPQAKIWHKVSSSFIGGKPHMHYFWWRSRLLWIERNCPFKERKNLYKKVVFPELWKHLRHYLLKSVQSLLTQNPEAKEKARRYRAGLAGALHYSLGRFGNCPKWIIK